MNDFNRGALPVPCLRLEYGLGEQWASVELGDGTGYVRLSDHERVLAENAKLRDAMYTSAGKRALQHMDEDELRIWATQQSEYIEELRELCAEMYRDVCGAYVSGRPLEPYQYESRVQELGIEAE